VRTSFDLPDALYRQLKRRAAAEGLAMRDLLLRALQGYLGRVAPAPYALAWRATPGAQLVPDDVLTSRERLGDWLDAAGERRGRD
jgi:hypothetical protein